MKIYFFLVLIFSLIIIAAFFIGCSSFYAGPMSDHFDGSEFYNEERDDQSFGQTIKWLWEMDTVEWPEWIEDSIQPPPPAYIDENRIRITYINHATVLLQMDSINILTDPIWSDYAGPVSFMAAHRVRKPGLILDNLPPIDFILITHDHFDHLDFPTLEKLLEKHNPIILTGLGNSKRLKSLNYESIVELDWWNEYRNPAKQMDFIFVPAKHRSGRGLFDGNETLWGGFVIKGKKGKVLFFGDTAFGDFLNAISNKYAGFDLVILPIGSYEKRWFMKNQHMNPDDAVLAHTLLKSGKSVGIHFGTFKEHPEQTIDAHEIDLVSALEKYNVSKDDFLILKFGEGKDITLK